MTKERAVCVAREMSAQDDFRFFTKIRVLDAYPGVPLATPCWEWRGSLFNTGYGQFKATGHPVLAHRLVFPLLFGVPASPRGMHVDHLCRRPACVNPDHLEPVTPRVNTLRGNAPAARNIFVTHCPYGHEYTPENTRMSKGCRLCKACDKRRDRQRKDRMIVERRRRREGASP